MMMIAMSLWVCSSGAVGGVERVIGRLKVRPLFSGKRKGRAKPTLKAGPASKKARINDPSLRLSPSVEVVSRPSTSVRPYVAPRPTADRTFAFLGQEAVSAA